MAERARFGRRRCCGGCWFGAVLGQWAARGGGCCGCCESAERQHVVGPGRARVMSAHFTWGFILLGLSFWLFWLSLPFGSPSVCLADSGHPLTCLLRQAGLHPSVEGDRVVASHHHKNAATRPFVRWGLPPTRSSLPAHDITPPLACRQPRWCDAMHHRRDPPPPCPGLS